MFYLEGISKVAYHEYAQCVVDFWEIQHREFESVTQQHALIAELTQKCKELVPECHLLPHFDNLVFENVKRNGLKKTFADAMRLYTLEAMDDAMEGTGRLIGMPHRERDGMADQLGGIDRLVFG